MVPFSPMQGTVVSVTATLTSVSAAKVRTILRLYNTGSKTCYVTFDGTTPSSTNGLVMLTGDYREFDDKFDISSHNDGPIQAICGGSDSTTLNIVECAVV